MPCVLSKVKNSTNGDQLVQELIEAANNATPPDIIPRARVDRDASTGKVVSVDIGLPTGIAQADLDAAATAIDSHSGVAASAPFPKTGTSDFNSLTPNTALTFPIMLNSLKLQQISITDCQWEGSTAAEAVGGTGSAMRLTDTNTSGSASGANYAHRMSTLLSVTAADLGLTGIGAFEIEFDVKVSDTSGATSNTTGDVSNSITVTTTSFEQLLVAASAFENDEWSAENGRTGAFTSSGVAATDAGGYVHVKMVRDLSGKETLTVGTATITSDPGFLVDFPTLDLSINNQSIHSTATIDQRSILIDNLTVKIVSGTL